MYCSTHGRINCRDFYCQQAARKAAAADNAGDLSIDPRTGDLNIGIGGGLTVDLEDGDIGVEAAPGIALDF